MRSTAPYFESKREDIPREFPTRAQALCLSGGGYRGLYTARILEHLATLTTHPLRAHFRFIAGTSIGALIAAALAAEISPQHIRQTIQSKGPQLFARKPFHSLYQWFRAPYDSELLSECLDQLFADAKPRGLLDQPVHD